jgi:hypothetical protein
MQASRMASGTQMYQMLKNPAKGDATDVEP